MKLKYLKEDYVPKGQIKDFPLEIIDKILEYQVEQGNDICIEAFEKSVKTYLSCMDWSETKEGYDFWKSVIFYKNFNLFFIRYPKETKNLFSIYVEVSKILENHHLKKENSLMLKNILSELCEFYKESNGVLDKLLLEVNSLPKVQDYLQKTQNLTEACISILRAFSLENEQRPPHIVGVHIKNAIIKLSVIIDD